MLVFLVRDATAAATTVPEVNAVHRRAIVCTVVTDFSNLDSLDAAWESATQLALRALDGRHVSVVHLFNNAGSLGELGLVSELMSLAQLRTAIDVNVTAPTWLTSRFLSWLRNHAPFALPDDGAANAPPCVVLNVSSLAAVRPLVSMGVYCTGKAARDMLTLVVAAESALPDLPRRAIKTLSYAPGPLDTEMSVELCTSPALEANMRANYVALRENRAYVSPAVSAAVALRLIVGNEYESGSHIDYYDAVGTHGCPLTRSE